MRVENTNFVLSRDSHITMPGCIYYSRWKIDEFISHCINAMITVLTRTYFWTGSKKCQEARGKWRIWFGRQSYEAGSIEWSNERHELEKKNQILKVPVKLELLPDKFAYQQVSYYL